MFGTIGRACRESKMEPGDGVILEEVRRRYGSNTIKMMVKIKEASHPSGRCAVLDAMQTNPSELPSQSRVVLLSAVLLRYSITNMLDSVIALELS